MIYYLKGMIGDAGIGAVYVIVNDVGYKVFVSNFFKEEVLGKDTEVWVASASSGRDAPVSLFGFATKEEREFFDTLTSVSGVGPKSALSIISLSSVSVIKRAISEGNVDKLNKEIGIPKRRAEKIVLELGKKLVTAKEGDSDLVEALTSLGYKAKEVEKVGLNIDENLPLEKRVKKALELLKNN